MPKATITVQAPAERPDILDIRDAMQQVLDFFDLLTSEEDRNTLAWNMTLASTNSPFTAQAEAVSVRPGIDVRAVATARIGEVSEYMTALARGRAPRRAMDSKRRNAARRLWRRNTNGIGRTTVQFDLPKVEPITVTPSLAATALEAFAKQESLEFSYLPEKRERTEFGSVEGALIDVGTDYKFPAVRIVERKSGREIVCRVEQAVVDAIASQADFRDVWERRRVRVRGRIVFDTGGQISRVYANTITPLSPRTMTLRDIEDQEFTEEVPTADYLERLREGGLGH
ncbi:MAG: hypothetical protein JO051_00860 [Acidobacteriaceae bacterium]|nr:hypothetical protein [Acidobacteriaceae bacterium]